MSVVLPEDRRDVSACHCAMCRRWCGGPWLGLNGAGAVIEGASLRTFRSSGHAERGFCGTCGANIFYRLRDGPEQEVSAGLFEVTDMRLSSEIFHDAKPTFYAFGGQTVKESGLRVKLRYAPRVAFRLMRRGTRRLLGTHR